MAISLSTAFVTLFEAEVKQAYQAVSQLVPATRQRRGVEGSTVKFPKLGRGVAAPRVPQTDVVAMNLTWTQATATLSDWNAAEYSDIFNQAKVNFEERRELVMAVASAIGRRQDQLILDGLNVPSGDRHWVCHANNLAGLLGDTQATSADYNSVRALVSGEIDTYLGFKFHVLGTRAEGGLPVSSGDRLNWAFHTSAVGYAEGIGPKVEINYIPEKTSWLVNALLSAGSIVIDTEGVAEITCKE